MASRYDFVKDINGGSDHKIWRIKVRVIRCWRGPQPKNVGEKPTIDMVVIDEKGDRIECMVRNLHAYIFENKIEEGNVYMFSNLSVALNKAPYKPTIGEFRLFFKRETQVRLIQDPSIPKNAFSFVPYSEILSEKKEDSRLVDVIGLVTGNGELIEYKKQGKQAHYIVLELDDLQSSQKLRCTLFEDFADLFLKMVEEDSGPQYIIILQFGKMSFFKGVMGVSNTNYSTRLYINKECCKVEAFRSRVASSETHSSQRLTPIVKDVVVSTADDLLNRCTYKSIADLKELNKTAVFVTMGTVKDIELEYQWFYMGCKKCLGGVKDDDGVYFCKLCGIHFSSYIPRYCIQIRVVDETDSASFVLFDSEASKFLSISAADLKIAYSARGGDKNLYPEELNALKDKTFIFKVNFKVKDMYSHIPYVIHISKLCYDEDLIVAFQKKYKVEYCTAENENSEINTQQSDSMDICKDLNSQFSGTAMDIGLSGIETPSKLNIDVSSVAKLTTKDDLNSQFSHGDIDIGLFDIETPSKLNIDVSSVAKVTVEDGDETQMPANKLRKIIREEK